jgi:hypothetical protein
MRSALFEFAAYRQPRRCSCAALARKGTVGANLFLK